ncbi:MAG: sugar ABC transporter ATP-binding protein [Streptosporangiaceae bacterium]
MSKSFSGRTVLSHVDLEVKPGEVHGLVGQNGSGKSTLIKVLAGYHKPDPGSRAWLEGGAFELGAVPADHGLNIRFVHQDLALVLQLNAMDNIALGGGYAKRRAGLISWRQQADVTHQALARFGVSIDIQVPLARLAPVERTAVAIVRALAGWEEKSGVLVLDEPTASLPASEVDRLHGIVREVSQQGAGVIYVSHRLDDVVAVADRISVLRDGELVGTYRADEVDSGQLASLMVGHRVERKRSEDFTADRTSEPVLTARALTARWLEDVDLVVWPGEIVGVSGVLGSGREELPYLLASASSAFVSGQVTVGGRVLPPASPRVAQRLGVGFVPADRLREAVISPFAMRENLTLAGVEDLATAGIVHRDDERKLVGTWIDKINVVPRDPERPLPKFSGGNQQKVILARMLSLMPKVLILAEPTAGVDVGAREAIYDVIRTEVTERQLAVVVASSDIQDLIALCHRVLVIRHGRIFRELRGSRLSYGAIVHATEGTEEQDPTIEESTQ